MKIQVFADLLDAHSVLAEFTNDQDMAEALRELAEAVRPGGSGTVAAIMKKLDKNSGQVTCDEVTKFSCQLGTVSATNYLVAVQKTLELASAKAAVSDFGLLIDFIAASKAKDIGQVATGISAALQKPAKAAKKNVAPPTVDLTVVRDVADRLTVVNRDPESFPDYLATVQANKSLSKATVDAIANRFLGIKLKYKSRAAAFQKIEERHFQDALNDSRGRTIDRIAI